MRAAVYRAVAQAGVVTERMSNAVEESASDEERRGMPR